MEGLARLTVVGGGPRPCRGRIGRDTKESSDGCVLWKNLGLDPSVAAEVLKPNWRDLFSDDERAVAVRWLRDCHRDVDGYLERLCEAGS